MAYSTAKHHKPCTCVEEPFHNSFLLYKMYTLKPVIWLGRERYNLWKTVFLTDLLLVSLRSVISRETYEQIVSSLFGHLQQWKFTQNKVGPTFCTNTKWLLKNYQRPRIIQKGWNFAKPCHTVLSYRGPKLIQYAHF